MCHEPGENTLGKAFVEVVSVGRYYEAGDRLTRPMYLSPEELTSHKAFIEDVSICP